jgi:phytoene dehydrogenase-like protein
MTHPDLAQRTAIAAHPGAGMPGVVGSAKATARVIPADLAA